MQTIQIINNNVLAFLRVIHINMYLKLITSQTIPIIHNYIRITFIILLISSFLSCIRLFIFIDRFLLILICLL